jgi:tRNA pseudouridine13 synthase
MRPKLRQIPEDFRVDEIASLMPAEGPYALYRLTKRSLGTPEVIEALLQRWRIDRRQVSFGGLKDRHAVTSQWLTIDHGPRRDLKQTNFELVYAGQAARPMTSDEIAGNRFEIVLRDLSESEAQQARAALAEVQREGLPNYFDRQRFGSLGESGEFIARPWCAGDYERAVWLAIADPNPHDRPRERAWREFLREHWGDWERCVAELKRSPWSPIVAHLARHPSDFRRAIALIRPDLRSLYVAAFQSFLWNRLLAEMIRSRLRPEQLVEVPIAADSLPFFRGLDDSQRSALGDAELPLPSARVHLEEGPLKGLVERAFAPLGLEMRQLRMRYPRDTFFSKGDRKAVVFPAALTGETADDELNRSRRKLSIAFELPRGSYATILTRRIALPLAA